MTTTSITPVTRLAPLSCSALAKWCSSAPRTCPPALPVPFVCRRRIARLIAEITLERGNLVALERKVLDIPERFAVLCPANILHEHLGSLAEHRLQLEPIDERALRVPTLRFVRALADVIVARGAGEREVVRREGVHGAP